MLTVDRVQTASDLQAFLDFPIRLYGQDPAWVQPLRAWQHRRLSARNPFLREATLHLYVARRDGEVVGTISALRDPRHEAARGESVGFFGFFECGDDPIVAGALIDCAAAQVRAWGLATMRGPRNLTRIEEVGVTVDGYDIPPPLLAGHHGPWQARLLEGLGFTAHHDHLAYEAQLFDDSGQPLPLPERLVRGAAAVHIPGLVVRPPRRLRMREDLRLAHTVFVEAFRDVPDNVPMPRDQFVNLVSALLFVTDTRMMQLAFVDERPVGFAICVPEINEAVVAARGRLLPTGWFRLLAATRRIRTASFKLLGLLPEVRRSGLHARLIEGTIEGVRAAGYRRLEASLVDERNAPMRRVVESSGMTIYKRYRVYERALGETVVG